MRGSKLHSLVMVVLRTKEQQISVFCRPKTILLSERSLLPRGLTSKFMKQTSFYETHKAAGATLVPFAGWDMPVSYAGTVAEVAATRSSAGIFEMSPYGRSYGDRRRPRLISCSP